MIGEQIKIKNQKNKIIDNPTEKISLKIIRKGNKLLWLQENSVEETIRKVGLEKLLTKVKSLSPTLVITVSGQHR
jgi:hypothetical protein